MANERQTRTYGISRLCYQEQQRGFGPMKAASYVIMLCLLTLPIRSDPCLTKQTCSECIQTPDCLWCSDPMLNGTHRCFNSSVGMEICADDFIFNPQNKIVVTSGEVLSSFSPQKISAELRANQKHYINFTYEVQNLPLDLYVLMDLSGSMTDDKDKLSSLQQSLEEFMNNITSDYRIGFGAFVDKPTAPYIRTHEDWIKHPCRNRSVPCDPAYEFRNHLSLQKNITLFTETVRKVNMSGNFDAPEGTLDAVLQAVTCTERINWRKNSRKVVLVATDNGFHIAGDGKLGGIIIPNDGECHLDSEGYYSMSVSQDYPSISLITQRIQEESAHVIFAVTSNRIQVYQELEKLLLGSRVEVLLEDSSNIVTLLQNQYNEISASVELKDDAEYVSVTYNPKGPDGSVSEGNKISMLKSGDIINVTAEIIVKDPPNMNDLMWKENFHIMAVGIRDSIAVDLQVFTDCPCSKEKKPNASECNEMGTLVCGNCACNSGRFGERCECNGTDILDDEEVCRSSNSSEICSGRGRCICGKCYCEEKEGVSGDYCECDEFSCEVVNGKICSGHGSCKCGTCICVLPWTGKACQCYNNTDLCKSPITGKECSGNGHCECGKCVCKTTDGLPYSGDFCEKDPVSGSKCDTLRDCVKCMVDNEEVKDRCVNCNFTFTLTESVEVNEENNEVQCFIEGECKRSFVYYTNEMNGEVVIRASRNEICPQRANIALISGIFLGAALLLGIICLIIWKLLTNYYDQVQYAKFEEEAKRARMNAMESPLYKPATSTYRNPLYHKQADS
ncbi:integrin beta-PS-like [Schistocerca nitens]|uniref:integrin beta-PS-like n=1 Tax=Schistocerca nitens TaxID=7011 RepID=UPI002117E747|nr:integrin beta-PS-like [Schistocerca nitens]